MLIAFICTGNTCRSPMAEAIFKQKIKGYEDFCGIISCGIRTFTGDTATEYAVTALEEMGIDLSAHRSSMMSSYYLDICDYLICMDEINYGIIEVCAGEKAILLGNGIEDPFGGDLDVYRTCAKQIGDELDKLLKSDSFFSSEIMRKDDIPVVAEIEKENFSEPWSETSFRNELDNDFSMCYVEKFLDKPVGYVCSQILCPEAYIGTIAVEKSMRKRGVADRLLNMVIDLCIYKNCKSLSLEVRVSNEAAIKLYEKNGFENLGIRKNFYSKPKEDAYIMTKYFKEDYL